MTILYIPRVLTFVTLCGCTKTRYDQASVRAFEPMLRLPLETRTRTEWVNGDFPSDKLQRVTTYCREFRLEEVRLDQGHMRYVLIYRERDRT